jgi:hypothetical protein
VVWLNQHRLQFSHIVAGRALRLVSGGEPTLTTSRFGASFALHDVDVAVEDQDHAVQAAQRQVFDRCVAVIHDQAPCGGRDGQCDALPAGAARRSSACAPP